ncbi:uncharacterized protein LOC133711706 [Rosa rugosa]|uniref:uncharacterized protein LOC133711706 n=1 Tax=Rosa rugosa TaxID=74645 RepID=UPI002B4108E3|nr:uncharacterized protein LOC133711706 [Rosa rugosa]
MEVSKIGSIPLSLRHATDRLVWHFDTKGLYSVKSGYHVYCNSLKMVEVASTSSEEVETGMHVFKQCEALQTFWILGPLKLKAKNHVACNLKGNNLVWKGGNFQPMHMLQWCRQSLEDFQKYHPKASSKKKRPLTKWKCPPLGRLKINIDGAYRADSGEGGIGVVVRDDSGTGIATIARPLLHAHSAINMEAEACRAGLLLGIH